MVGSVRATVEQGAVKGALAVEGWLVVLVRAILGTRRATSAWNALKVRGSEGRVQARVC